MKNFSNPLKLVKVLADGQFHSGEELAQLFSITRAGINKYTKVLREWGLALESISGKGYRLIDPLDLLDLKKIETHYPKQEGRKFNLQLLPIIDSTNQYLLDRISQCTSGDTCVAEYQYAARGRRGRRWFAPFGSNLYLSMYWCLEQGPAAAMGLSLVIGIVTAKILRELSGQDVKVKWPNDLYLNDKKLAGILVEIAGKTGDCAHVVLGLGINLNMSNPDEQIVNQAWAKLDGIDRNKLVAKLVWALQKSLEQFEEKGLSSFISQWYQLDNFIDRSVKLLIGDKVIQGMAKGINEQGALLLEQNGEIVPYIGGEISLRIDN